MRLAHFSIAGKSGTYNFLASPVSVRGGAIFAVPEHPIVSFDHDLLSHKSAMRTPPNEPAR